MSSEPSLLGAALLQIMDSDGEKIEANYEDSSDVDSKYTYSDEEKDGSSYKNMLSCKKDEILSLENICLKSIAENFESINNAYCTTENVVLRRNLVFLQRVYSNHVLTEATRNGQVKDSCLNFVLNEYLKELNFNDFVKCSPEAFLKRLTEIGHVITTVYVSTEVFASPFHSELFVNQALSHLPNVKVIHILSLANDETLQIISSCPKLEELYMDCSNISDEGLRNLCDKKDNTVSIKSSLKMISLRHTNVTEAGIVFLLENITSLEVVEYPNLPAILYSIHKDDLANNSLNTARKYNLTTLTFLQDAEVKNVSDILKVATQVCPQIKELQVPFAKESHLDLIAQFAQLEKLSLECLDATEHYLDFDLLAAQGGKLKQLKINHASFSVSTLLQICPKLESLDLTEVYFLWQQDSANTSQLNILQELRLTNLTFSETPTEKSVSILLNCSSKLERLYLSHCETAESDINTKIVNFCAKNTVKQLSLRYLDIPVNVLENILLTCSSLETLVLEDCDYIDSDAVTNLYSIVQSQKNNKVDIVWNDDGSEINSLNNFSDYNFHYSDEDLDDGDYYDGFEVWYDHDDVNYDDDDDDY